MAKRSSASAGFSGDAPNNPQAHGQIDYTHNEGQKQRKLQEYTAQPAHLKPAHEILFVANLINQVFTPENLAVWGGCMRECETPNSNDNEEKFMNFFKAPSKDSFDAIPRLANDGKHMCAIAATIVRVGAFISRNELFNLMKGAAMVQGNHLLQRGGDDSKTTMAKVLGQDLAVKLMGANPDTLESSLSKHWRSKYGNTWAGATAAAEDIAVQTAANAYNNLMKAFEPTGNNSFVSYLPV